jgi:hypothetical protein
MQDYRAGTLLTGQLKAMCIKKLQDEVKDFQEVSTRLWFRLWILLAELFRLCSGELRSLTRSSRASWTLSEQSIPLLPLLGTKLLR